MRLLPDRHQHERLVEIIRDYEAANALVELFLYIDGRDLSHYLESGTIKGGGGAVAWGLDATLSTRLENHLENSPVRLHAIIGGIPVPIFRGVMPVYDSPDEGYETDIICATPGHLLDKISLGEHTEYAGMSPHRVMQDAMFRVPLYNRSRVRIARFSKPIINLVGSDGFADAQTASDVLSEMLTTTNALASDDATDFGARIFRNPGAGAEGAPIVWGFDAQGRDVRSWTKPRFGSPDEQYRTVIVRDLLDDGSIRIKAQKPVNHAELRYPPFAGQIKWVDWVAPEGGSDVDATQMAADIARTLAGGVYTGQTEVAYNPLLEPGDNIVFRDIDEDESGKYARTWRCLILGISGGFSETLSTTLDYEATLTSEERIPDPPIRIRGLSAGNVPAQLIDFVIGLDPVTGYLWIDTDRSFNSSGQRWAGVNPNTGELWVDPDLSEGFAGINESGQLYLNPRLGPAVGFNTQGQLWIDPDRAISPFTGRKWAGIDPDTGELWVDPDVSDGIVTFSGNDLLPSPSLYPGPGLYPNAAGDFPGEDYPEDGDYPQAGVLLIDPDLALQQ